MTTTPPPPGRLRTPPTPLHGPRYDSYEPYSPRRSARVSSKRRDIRNTPEPSNAKVNVKSQVHHNPTSTPAPRKTTLTRQLSSQTLSPPSSPETQHRHTTPQQTKKSDNTVYEDVDGSELSTLFPTPNKTPLKHAAAARDPTARMLTFKPHSYDTVDPSPRKRKQPLTLDSFDEQQARRGRKIEVFTDSQDRIPDTKMSDENPFVGRRKTGTSSASAKGKRPENVSNHEDVEMEAAVRNDEGVLYTFRGKKILRRFDESEGDTETGFEPEDMFSQEAAIRRQAGLSAQRPFTRSSLKPRLLFPSKEQERDRQAVDAEEALTDIEVEDDAIPHVIRAGLQTPKKQSGTSFTAAPGHLTPQSRSIKKKSTQHLELQPVEEEAQTSPQALSPVTLVKKTQKTSPFDSWPRTKPTARASQNKKRAGDPRPEGMADSKRTRSGAN
ncbi:hypothetical protein MBLNU457_4013t1 [Dothideomycetes sp. NU457]